VPDVSIIIVSYNSRADLEESLPSVVGQSDDVIVVDNGSTDGSQQLVRDRFPSIRLLEFERNYGFGVANNEAARVANCRYLLLLNPDARPVANGIERLLSFAKSHPDVGVAGPRLVNPDGSLQRSIRGYPSPWWRGTAAIRRRRRLATAYFRLRWVRRRGRRRAGTGADETRTLDDEFLKGAVLLLPREAFEMVGGFDPGFFLFNEEIDLCLRLRRAGWTVAFVPEAVFVHTGGTATERELGWAYREQLRGHLRLLLKHRGMADAERARKFLRVVLTLRGATSRRAEGRLYRDAATWLGSGNVPRLLESER
jgi:GT2 family glycosyltransferase